MSLELARSLSATQDELDRLVEEYDHHHRDLAEALFLNSSLSSKGLSRLLDRCPADLRDLALKHQNLSAELQYKILDKAEEGIHKTRVKLILLERSDLDPGLFSLFLIDKDNVIRTKAQLRCAK
jgi:hypothetical protein